MTDYRRDDEPVHPLTDTEQVVANYAARGYGIQEIANRLGTKRSTVAGHVNRIAMKLTPEDGVSPLTRVQLWAAHKLWREQITLRQPAA